MWELNGKQLIRKHPGLFVRGKEHAQKHQMVDG